MIGFLISALIVAVYLFWSAKRLYAYLGHSDQILPQGRLFFFTRFFIATLATIMLVTLSLDLFYGQGGEGKVIQKTTVKSGQLFDESDPYDEISRSKSGESTLELTILKPDEIKTTFKDVAGQEEAKQEILEVVDFLKNPSKYEKLGAKIPKGVLLYGPPGTGKTLMARAVAGESNVTFIAVDGAAFDEMYVGVGASRVRELFNTAREHQPCIVFIDEIDALAPSRNEMGAVMSGRLQTINQLLAEMDNILDTKNAGIIVMAATNRLETLDTALLRPGRFDRKVFIRLPNYLERQAIIKLYLKKIPYDKSIQIESLAGTTYGFSGADIRNLINEAALHAARQNIKQVVQADFNYALDKVKLGLEVKSAIVSDEDKLLTAYHEAGHTIVGIFSEHFHYEFHKVTIGVRDATLGVTHFEATDDPYGYSRAFLEDQIAILFGGRAAEEMFVGKNFVTTGAANDLERATDIAQKMVTEWALSDLSYGISYKTLKQLPNDKINDEVEKILNRAHEKAKTILEAHKADLKILAEALVKKEILDKDEVFKLLKIKPEATSEKEHQ